jgi:hypothetical protein
MEWGSQLTAGLRTDTAATNGTGVDTLASASIRRAGLPAGHGIDGHRRHSEDPGQCGQHDVRRRDGLSFTAVLSGAAPASQRLATANNATIRRYLRAITVTTGGFTSATFNVVINRTRSPE